jgi:hypothetical protein
VLQRHGETTDAKYTIQPHILHGHANLVNVGTPFSVDPESSSVHVSYWLDRTTAKNAIVPTIDHPSKKEMV